MNWSVLRWYSQMKDSLRAVREKDRSTATNQPIIITSPIMMWVTVKLRTILKVYVTIVTIFRGEESLAAPSVTVCRDNTRRSAAHNGRGDSSASTATAWTIKITTGQEKNKINLLIADIKWLYLKNGFFLKILFFLYTPSYVFWLMDVYCHNPTQFNANL